MTANNKRSAAENWLLSNEEMRATLNIARAVNAARRRDPDSRLKIAKTLVMFASGLVDGDAELARGLVEAMRQFCTQLEAVDVEPRA